MKMPSQLPPRVAKEAREATNPEFLKACRDAVMKWAKSDEGKKVLAKLASPPPRPKGKRRGKK